MSRIRTMLFAVTLSLISLAVFAAPVDINTADAQTLAAELSGVGLAKAEAIVAHRKQHGPFRQVEDLLQVKGIGAAIVEKNRSVMVVKAGK